MTTLTEVRPETRPAPVEPTTPIRPSEAIRLGCLIAPVQAFEQFGEGDHACALGAMVAGYNGWGDEHDAYGPPVIGPVARAMDPLYEMPTCPACEDGPGWQTTNMTVIEHLNDDHRWTREAIADWLAGQGY